MSQSVQELRADQSASFSGTMPNVSLPQLFLIFLKIGSMAFGGYMVLVALVERELAQRRSLIKNQDILDGLALGSALPGPVAVNLVAYIGFLLKGFVGALVCMTGVILPSFILFIGLAEIYVRFGESPAITSVFAGFLPAVVAIILCVAYRMGRQTITKPIQLAIAITVFALFVTLGGFLTAIGLILASGVIGIALFLKPASAEPSHEVHRIPSREVMKVVIVSLVLLLGTLCWRAIPWGGVLRELWLSFSGMSLVMFGGGYVFIPMMKEMVVQHHQWLTTREFADAIALGQVSPGPIMITAAFIGYQVAWLGGALLATIAMFLPSGMLMMFFGGVHERVGQSPFVKAAHQGIRPCIVGLVVSAALVLSRSVELTWVSGIIFLAALIATGRYRLDTIYVIPAAGLVGLLSHQLL